MLFSDIKREYTGYRLHGEPHYDYINRSARHESARVRNIIEEWFSHYPAEHQKRFLGDFQSGHDYDFVSSFFELYLHELLICLGYGVKIHPQIPSGLKAPDFLVSDKDGNRFYLEAVFATDESKEKRGAKACMNEVFDIIDHNLKCTDFYIGMSMEGSPKKPVPSKKLCVELDGWLYTLDADELIEEFDGNEDIEPPKYFFEYAGWKIKFAAFPRSPEKRGIPGIRPLSTWVSDAQWKSTWEDIRDAVKKKGKKYKTLDAPFIIAVNTSEFSIDKLTIEDALFGQEYIQVRVLGNKTEERPGRHPNGAWWGPNGPQYRRISGVIIAPEVTPWSIAGRRLILYHNPYNPYFSINGNICKLPQAIPKNGRMEWLEGKHPRDILDLPESWPRIGS